MNKFLFFVAFWAIFQQATAQTVVSDTSYLTFSTGRFFDVRVITFEDGSSETFSRFVCDTSTAYRYFSNETNVASAALANRVREANRIGREAGAIRSKLLYVAQVAPVAILDSFMRDFSAPFRNQTWVLSYAGGADTVRFTTTVGGQGRYQVGDNAVRQYQIVGPDLLWLVNSPVGVSEGSVVRLYRMNAARYESVGRTYILRRVSQSAPQARNAAPPPDDAPMIMPVSPAKQQKRQKQ